MSNISHGSPTPLQGVAWLLVLAKQAKIAADGITVMLSLAYSIAFPFALAIPAYGQTRIDAISTTFRWIGPNDKIAVERNDDPKVANVSCYMSRADTGGIKGGLGFAEDPSRFAIARRAVGPVAIPS